MRKSPFSGFCFGGINLSVSQYVKQVGFFMQIDYLAYHSGMKNWNAGIKMLLAVGTLCLTILLDRPLVSVFVIVTMGALTLLAGKIPFKAYLHFMTIPLTFILLSGFAIAVQFSFHPMGEWNISLRLFYLCFTKKSMETAFFVFLKAIAGMSCLFMLSLSTPVSEVILVLQKLHLPRLLTELMNLIYRYIFILLEAAQQMQTAAKARLGYHSFSCALKSFAMIAGNLFLLSLKKANAYYDALLSRGYEGKLEFLTEDMPVKKWQVAGSLCYFLLLLGFAAVSAFSF